MPSPRRRWDALDTIAYAAWVDDHPELEDEIEAKPEPPKYRVGRANYEPAMTPQREAELIAEISRLRIENARLEFRLGELRAEVERPGWIRRAWERVWRVRL